MKNLYKSFWLLTTLFFISFFSNNALALAEEYPKDYKDEVIRYMSKTLKDSSSAQYQFDRPFIAKVHDIDEYIIRVHINAKNSYGAYTGYKKYYFTYDKRYFGGSVRDITGWVDAGVIKIE